MNPIMWPPALNTPEKKGSWEERPCRRTKFDGREAANTGTCEPKPFTDLSGRLQFCNRLSTCRYSGVSSDTGGSPDGSIPGEAEWRATAAIMPSDPGVV